jgi:hypothetical protein
MERDIGEPHGGELLTEGQVLDHEAALRPEPRDHSSDDRREKSNHGGRRRCRPWPKNPLRARVPRRRRDSVPRRRSSSRRPRVPRDLARRRHRSWAGPIRNRPPRAEEDHLAAGGSQVRQRRWDPSLDWCSPVGCTPLWNGCRAPRNPRRGGIDELIDGDYPFMKARASASAAVSLRVGRILPDFRRVSAHFRAFRAHGHEPMSVA